MDSIWRAERVVAGRYRLAAPVGEGAMGTVWRAFDLRLGRVVAIKQLRLPHEDEAVLARRRVIREARAAARLQHPNAVAVHDVATDDLGNPVLVMEYVPSRSLAAVLDEGGVLPVAQVARIGTQIAGALAAGHAAGIVHRDVKPANILLAEDGSAKITDFGLARSIDDTVTETGLLAGTPAFLAPETAHGEPPTPAADVFSLGATLYTALEGTPPFGTADDHVEQLHRVAAGGAPPPRNAGGLKAPLMAMLHDDPAARPTMSHVADVLAEGGSPPTRLDLRATPAAAPAPPMSRRNMAFVVVAALVAGLLTLLLLSTWPVGRADRGAAAAELTSTSALPPTPDTEPDPEQLRQIVTRFYALLDDDPAQAWALLGPDLRAQGRDRFEERWRDVADLRVVGTPTVSGTTVVVEIEYTADGTVRETHRHTLVTDGGPTLIASDEVLTATTEPGTTTTTTTTTTSEDKGRGRGQKKDGPRGGGN